ncbi:3-methyl-2-oxobutanoate hydroxymethyltransferase [uncultured Paracoccus sp.]|uniref:3-methyl-2-oxobutanoate hydroxymethyltransferase n=1 Tax=uncultured Paracoccus sp. TaxID=189685 RepID=UPI0025D5952A|nr:3-methyl-2-oxobutanoate hydroxymethyltransferase [uncultured Paracoccus sp.]
MSVETRIKRVTAPQILARKGGTPIVALTAYTAPLAAKVDSHADIILVGDSLGMVVHGLPSTIGVTMEMMILHGQAVMRGSQQAMVVIDMPFGSYEESPQQAFRNAARIMGETGAGAVKLEGGSRMAATIRFMAERGIPVMGHVGLTPQQTHTLGGFKTQGRETDSWARHVQDAVDVAEAGAFSIVVEGVVEELADRITRAVAIPTIGIGASVRCDGQILVLDDMLGLTGRVPRFVHRFADMGQQADRAIADYAAAVRDRTFPADENVYR